MTTACGLLVDKETFRDRLARVLTDRGRTVYWLAKIIGKPSQTVAKWADGTSEPGAFTLAKAEKALRLPPGYLVNDDVDDSLPVPPAPTDDDASKD